MVKNYYMTGKDFTSFLEDVGGLENGYFTDRPRIKEAGFFAIGPGWYGLVKELIEGAIAAGWDRQICQVKEKFGGLRFYHGGVQAEEERDSHMAMGAIQQAEEMSFHVCEECGASAELRQSGWFRTLCDECWTEEQARRRERSPRDLE